MRRLQQDVFAAQFLDAIEQSQAVGFREVLDEAVKGDEVELFVDFVLKDVRLNVVIVNAAFAGEVDGIRVGVEAGGLHAGPETAEVRVGAAADVECGLDFLIGDELRRVVRSGLRAQQLSERVGHAPVSGQMYSSMSPIFSSNGSMSAAASSSLALAEVYSVPSGFSARCSGTLYSGWTV